MKILGKNTILLCRNKRCCPVVEKQEDGTFVVKDDFKGSVKLTSDEIDMLKEAADKLQSK